MTNYNKNYNKVYDPETGVYTIYDERTGMYRFEMGASSPRRNIDWTPAEVAELRALYKKHEEERMANEKKAAEESFNTVLAEIKNSKITVDPAYAAELRALFAELDPPYRLAPRPQAEGQAPEDTVDALMVSMRLLAQSVPEPVNMLISTNHDEVVIESEEPFAEDILFRKMLQQHLREDTLLALEQRALERMPNHPMELFVVKSRATPPPEEEALVGEVVDEKDLRSRAKWGWPVGTIYGIIHNRSSAATGKCYCDPTLKAMCTLCCKKQAEEWASKEEEK